MPTSETFLYFDCNNLNGFCLHAGWSQKSVFGFLIGEGEVGHKVTLLSFKKPNLYI